MDSDIISLNRLPIGKKANIYKLLPNKKIDSKLLDLGLIENTTIKALQKSPGGDPTAYCIRGSVIALRNEDAEKILVYLSK